MAQPEARDVAGSVIIPAWNEQEVIGRTLVALHCGVEPGALEVIVACNGCTDDTAAVVRRTDLPVVVLELGAIGKSAAIREAEATTATMPRLYLDADVELPGPSALVVLRRLAGGAVACRPPIEYRTIGAAWPVRRFYATRADLPGIAGDLCGAGVYGLSAAARARFDAFPDFCGDDLFAARMVSASEVLVAECEPVVVHVPRTARALVRTLGRVYRGNREVSAHLPSSTAGATVADLLRVGRQPSRWLDVAVYAALVLAGRVASTRPSRGWARDDTARVIATDPR